MPAPRKPCSICREHKDITEFGRNRQATDGLHYYCKTCAALKQKNWAALNPAVIRRSRKKYLDKVRATNALHGDPYTRAYAEAA